MAWSLKEHKSEPDRLGHLLYWQQLQGADDVVWQNDNSLLSTIAYRGPDMESANAQELTVLRARLHDVLMGLDAGWMVQAEERKHYAEPYQERRWQHPVAALIDEERRAQVGEPGTHFETSYHLNFTKYTPRSLGSWWQHLWFENMPEGHADIDMTARFRDQMKQISGDLQGVFEDATWLKGDALATYLHSTVSQYDQPYVAIPEAPYYLNRQLTDTPLYPGMTPKLGERWLRPIVIKNKPRQPGLPRTTYPGILDVLHDLPMEYRAVWRWLPLSYNKANSELNWLENNYRGGRKSLGTMMSEWASGKPSDKVNQAAGNAAAEIQALRSLIDEGQTKLGYMTMVVLVWDTDFAVAEEKARYVEQCLRTKGFLAYRETLDAVGAYLSTIPGDGYHNVEKPPITLLNYIDMVPTTSVWAGPRTTPHLKRGPLFVATARGQTPFRGVLHDGDVGDYFVIGPKGSGKSAKQAFLAAQWMEDDGACVRALDKGSSLRALTHAMNGNWIDLSPKTARPLQPYARIDDAEERAWAWEWTGDLVEMAHVPRTPEVMEELSAGLYTLADFAPRHRTMTGLCGLLQSATLRQALAPYTIGREFPFLDGDEDWLQMSHWDCFEMERLLDDYPRLVPPVFSFIARRIERALEGAPTMISIDECHAFFAIEAVAKRQFQWLKTFRRKNAILGFLTQNPLDIRNCAIGDEIIQACPTKIFCPNPSALVPDVMQIYIHSFNLTRRQCELIAYSTPKRDYYYVGRQGKRLYQLHMGPVTLAYCGRSGEENLKRINRVWDAATEPFGIAWLRDEGLEDIANMLGEAYATNEKAPVYA